MPADPAIEFCMFSSLSSDDHHQHQQQRIQQNVLTSNVFQDNSLFSFEPLPISSTTMTNTGGHNNNVLDDQANQHRLLQSLGNVVRDSEEVFSEHFNEVDNNVMNRIPSMVTLPNNNKEKNNSALPVHSSSSHQHHHHQQQVSFKKRPLFLEEQHQPASFPFSSLSNPTIQPLAKKQCNRTKMTMNEPEGVPSLVPVSSSSSLSSSTNSLATTEDPSSKQKNRFRYYQADQWCHMLDQLVFYKAKYGHCSVPHTSKEFPELGRWYVTIKPCVLLRIMYFSLTFIR